MAVCTPCKRDDHWECPDVNGGDEARRYRELTGRTKYVVVPSRNPGCAVGQDGTVLTAMQTRKCDCQHQPRSSGG